MVTITNYTERQAKDGRTFITLELTGDAELVLSQASGRHYATVRKVSVPATFDESMAKSLIGSKLPGAIVRVESDPYEYVKKSTGEVMVLNYVYAYQANPEAELVGHTPVKDLQTA